MNRVSWEVFNKRSEKLWLRTWALSNPLANPQISMLHCFQEVHSHQHSVQAEDLETVQALQAMELDGRACVCFYSQLCMQDGMCLCVHRRMTVWGRGLSRRILGSSLKLWPKESNNHLWVFVHKKHCRQSPGHYDLSTDNMFFGNCCSLRFH